MKGAFKEVSILTIMLCICAADAFQSRALWGRAIRTQFPAAKSLNQLHVSRLHSTPVMLEPVRIQKTTFLENVEVITQTYWDNTKSDEEGTNTHSVLVKDFDQSNPRDPFSILCQMEECNQQYNVNFSSFIPKLSVMARQALFLLSCATIAHQNEAQGVTFTVTGQDSKLLSLQNLGFTEEHEPDKKGGESAGASQKLRWSLPAGHFDMPGPAPTLAVVEDAENPGCLRWEGENLKLGPGDEMINWVDESGEALCTIPRSVVHKLNILHRGAGILVQNKKGEIYVHQRTASKRLFPSMYDMFVGGVSLSGESPEEVARREIQEELGVGHKMSQPLKYLFDITFHTSYNRAFVDVFEYTCEDDEEIKWQESEVCWGKFMSVPEIHSMLLDGKEFVPDGLFVWEKYFQYFLMGKKENSQYK